MKLKIDENWRVEIPPELREKFNLKKDGMVDVNFGPEQNKYSADFDSLLKTLAHDGILINIKLN